METSNTLSNCMEKLTVVQLLKKFFAFYGNRRSISVYTRARHWSLYPEPDESVPHFPTPMSVWSIIILSYYLLLGLPSDLFLLAISDQDFCVHFLCILCQQKQMMRKNRLKSQGKTSLKRSRLRLKLILQDLRERDQDVIWIKLAQNIMQRQNVDL